MDAYSNLEPNWVWGFILKMRKQATKGVRHIFFHKNNKIQKFKMGTYLDMGGYPLKTGAHLDWALNQSFRVKTLSILCFFEYQQYVTKLFIVTFTIIFQISWLLFFQCTFSCYSSTSAASFLLVEHSICKHVVENPN